MMKISLFLVASVCIAGGLPQYSVAQIVKVYLAEVQQAVAVDADYFYVINNSSISKHRKRDGRFVKRWEDQDSLIQHLNSGIIIDSLLYSCNSNYPEYPMASSIEIFDPKTLTHTGNHSFGITNGSATWLDRYQGYWYVAFAHYTGRGGEPTKDNRWTRLVKFNDDWQQIESWIFPKALIDRFGNRSNSGGVITEDGRLLITGHDAAELYQLRFPSKGYRLLWEDTLSVGFAGQGIAYEKQESQEYVYGIIRDENKVIVYNISDSF